MSRQTGLSNAYELVAQYLSIGMSENAFELLEYISQQYTLTGQDAEDYNDFVELFGLMQSFLACQPAIDTLSSLQIEILIQMVNSDRPVISKLALGLLFRNNPLYDYQEEILTPPDYSPRTGRQPTLASEKDAAYMQLRPNPTKGYVEVSYRIGLPDLKGLSLSIIDARGRVVSTRVLDRQSADILLDVSHLASGAYSVIIQSSRKILVQQKLQIVN